METYKLTIFGREHDYECSKWGLIDLDTDQGVCKTLKEKVLKPTVLSYVGYDPIDFFVLGDRHYIQSHMVDEIEQLAMRITHRSFIQEAILECSTDLTHVIRSNMYRDIRLNPCITDPITEMLDQYIADISKLRTEIAKNIEIEKREKEKRKEKWKEIHRYTFIRPNEDDDGYLDADYESQDGSIIRMVSRDVFDFGCYSYPKRVEGTEDVLYSERHTEKERDLEKWLYEFGPFRGIRM